MGERKQHWFHLAGSEHGQKILGHVWRFTAGLRKEKRTSLLLPWVQQRVKFKGFDTIWAFFVSFIWTVQFLVSCCCITETVSRPFLLLCKINYNIKIPPTKNKENKNSRLFTLDSFFFAFWGKEGLWRNTICFVDKFPSLKRNKCTLLRMN